jgi:hypothetical protein
MYSGSLGEPWLNEDLIARVQERMRQLRGQWNATGPSKTMDCSGRPDLSQLERLWRRIESGASLGELTVPSPPPAPDDARAERRDRRGVIPLDR